MLPWAFGPANSRFTSHHLQINDNYSNHGFVGKYYIKQKIKMQHEISTNDKL